MRTFVLSFAQVRMLCYQFTLLYALFAVTAASHQFRFPRRGRLLEDDRRRDRSIPTMGVNYGSDQSNPPKFYSDGHGSAVVSPYYSTGAHPKNYYAAQGSEGLNDYGQLNDNQPSYSQLPVSYGAGGYNYGVAPAYAASPPYNSASRGYDAASLAELCAQGQFAWSESLCPPKGISLDNYGAGNIEAVLTFRTHVTV